MIYLFDEEPPIGLTMDLAMDLAGISHHPDLTEAEKEELLNRARDAKSVSEMRDIINSIHNAPAD